MKLELLEDLYRQKLAELQDAERQLVRFLPKMALAFENPALRNLFENHARETKVQCRRLDQVIARRGVSYVKKSKAMSGILSEAKELLRQEKTDPQVLTIALLSAAQEVEGHEITCYAFAHSYARLLGFHEDLKPLEETFHEEKRMEQQLAAMAQSLGLEERESEEEVLPARA